MINVQEARQLIHQHSHAGRIIEMELPDAAGFILAEPVTALIDTPPFDQSAMDGYAFAFDQLDGTGVLQVSGEVQAGAVAQASLQRGQAVRIFTGAAVPEGADTVVMQEKVERNGVSIKILDEQIRKGSNVRLKASQNSKGSVIMEAGEQLSPAGVSFLAGNGILKVKVYDHPKVHIIVTGKELVKPGEPIRAGEIFESNSYGLKAALKQLGIGPVEAVTVDDDEAAITAAIKDRLNGDMLIMTGGVSVGEYDFVASGLARAGVKQVFHKVKQKPGKPFYFGVHNDTLVFALPGNPAAVLTCFYTYIVPVISRFTHKDHFRSMQLPLLNTYSKKAGLTHFLKGKISKEGVTILGSQESYLMNSFAQADCIVELPEEKENFETGEILTLTTIV